LTKENLSLDAFKIALENRNCQWIFNPPGASHYGGDWERKIGAIRRILETSFLRLDKRHLSRDELSTFLQEAANIVNQTPLWEVSSSLDDPLPLTPAMLLTLKSEPEGSPVAEIGSTDVLAYGARRWRRVQAIAEEFWLR
jgi:hypothetical protein